MPGKRRGGSGCGNGRTLPGTESRGSGRVGPSVSKITRARNRKRPGTSGGGRKQESEALNRTGSVAGCFDSRGRLSYMVCSRGSRPVRLRSGQDLAVEKQFPVVSSQFRLPVAALLAMTCGWFSPWPPCPQWFKRVSSAISFSLAVSASRSASLRACPEHRRRGRHWREDRFWLVSQNGWLSRMAF